jgi:hypothetical protein
MKPRLAILTVALCLLLVGLPGCAALQTPAPTAVPSPTPTPQPTSTPAVFDDTDANTLRLTNDFYEVGLSKANGAILYISDRSSGQRVSQGNRKARLWAVSFTPGIDNVESSTFTPAGPNRFSYAWSPSEHLLTLHYAPDPAAKSSVGVTVTLDAGSGKGFTLRLALQNNWGYAPYELKFPADLVFTRGEVQQALLPILPGIVLEKSFFGQGRNFQTAYPGYPGVFADFMALTSTQGSFGVYASNPAQAVIPTTLGFNFDNCAGAEAVCYTHVFKVRVKNASTWTSPTVRLSAGESWQETIAGFRADSGIAQDGSLSAKLGEMYTQMAQSPLYKADSSQLGLPFSSYPGMLANIPYPGILHVVGYEPGGFDRNYPDLLPPDPRWGTTQEFAAMFDKAHSMGFLTAPYVNPTWWDAESPTLRNLPRGTLLSNVVALTEMGNQAEECYGCPDNPHYGYVVSPYSPFVQQRLSQLLQQMKKEAHSDLVFEDQIGARAGLYDYNPVSPSPEAYLQGWVDHTRTYAADRLMTEMGFDRLVGSEVGFHGSVLLLDRTDLTGSLWPANTWHYYPFAASLARDKAFFYQHDLAPETFTHRRGILGWNVAMGYMLSYDLFTSDFGGGVNNPYIAVVGAFQRFVLSKYANERVTGFSSPNKDLTQTKFESVSAYVNWSSESTFNLSGYTIPPLGMLILKDDGSLAAGVFTAYNGQALSSGDHYLIEERGAQEILVRQPMGSDTPLAIQMPADWKAAALTAQAYDLTGQPLGETAITLDQGNLMFTYQMQAGGKPVAYYRIAPKTP